VNKKFSREANDLPPEFSYGLSGQPMGISIKTTERILPEQRFGVTTGGNAAEWNVLHSEMGQ
jgi:hypothetical protein